MVTATDNFVTVNGIRLQYTEFGDRANPDMLCLHGFTLEAHSWDDLAERMSGRYHVVCPSVPGHGDSDRRQSYDDPFADIHLIAAFMDELGIAPATVLGHSMGGSYAGGLAVFHPAKVERIVLVDAGLDTRPPGAAAFRSYIDGWKSVWGSMDEARAFLEGHFPDTTPAARDALMRNNGVVAPDGTYRMKLDPTLIARSQSAQEEPEVSPLWPMLAQIKCPVLIVRGEKTQLLRREIVEAMVKDLPDGRWTEALGVGHGMQLEDVDAVYDAIKDFLELP